MGNKFVSDLFLLSLIKNSYGQLGTGNRVTQTIPVVISGEMSGREIVDISTNVFHTLAVDSNGRIYSVRRNFKFLLIQFYSGDHR